jgi:hypothetical protein
MKETNLTHSLFGRLLPCCATESGDTQKLQALLDKQNIGILSAACCDATAARKDEQLKSNLLQAMQGAGDDRAVVVETITAAQRNMRQIENQADAQQKRLIANVVQLFQSNGLSVFPILIINGRVACYGGVPSVELIRRKLQPLIALGA